ncbi:uncharacterized protein AB675_8991 [Cyphellophora attinorum]|uniref:GST N-terminal domain-containing protein n=1 Tax=Cyphellophora attinorum TaxID=1664694 RepID=A0A0N1P214_9EURO|nr:uncharacterized protein AB675_8991 [Phialophora attinorum]KPI41644.1 hypothetical protein AB675_8991 [Phialophora attinorum]
MANPPNNGIILYHYSYSPFARRVVWYLALRGIDYAECRQPPVMPRPDLKAIGVNYRRIPVCAIGRDVYCDSRIIIQKLEQMFPQGKLGSSVPHSRGIEKLLEIWQIEAGVFGRGAALIPSDGPLSKDKKFQKDREEFSGRPWSKEAVDRNRPEAVAAMRNYFRFMESTILEDGRDYILGTKEPSLADIEGVWVFHWMRDLKGALPGEMISAKQFPKVFAWIERFDKAVKAAKAKNAKPASLKGDAAAKRVLDASFADQDIGVDESDPLKLQKGQEVEIWPTDSGFGHRDRGALVGLNEDEVVIAVDVSGKEVRLHFPRINFRIAAVGSASNL